MSSVRTIHSLARVAAPALRLRPQTGARHLLAPRSSTPLSVRSFTASTASWKKLYTEDHEWIELDSDGTTGTVGISTYAAKALGDIVFVELPTVDDEVSAGDVFGAVESVKSASDLLCPASGTVLEVNGDLEKTPKTINSSPESEGWICKIKVASPEELHNLMEKDKYDEFTGDEAS